MAYVLPALLEADVTLLSHAAAMVDWEPMRDTGLPPITRTWECCGLLILIDSSYAEQPSRSERDDDATSNDESSVVKDVRIMFGLCQCLRFSALQYRPFHTSPPVSPSHVRTILLLNDR